MNTKASMGCACGGASSGLGEGVWLTEVSTDPGPALLVSKHPAKTLLNYQKCFSVLTDATDGDGEGWWVTVLCRESFLGQSAKLCPLNTVRQLSGFIV